MSQARITLRAPAKLNLGLRILDRRGDGYHEIETIFLPLRLFDELELEAREGGRVSVEVDHAGLPCDDANLAVRGARAALEALGLRHGVAIRLRKQIPVAAGLGGGSSDAAAALLGVEALFERSLDPVRRRALAARIGADVPFFLDPRPSLGRGIGERLVPLADVPEMFWVLICFPFGISSAEAYAAADAELTLPRQGSSIAALLGTSGIDSPPINDLEPFAVRRHPELRAARAALEQVGASITGMSGSGPTVYGRFDEQDAAQRAVRSVRVPPGARTIATSSPGSRADDWGWGVAKR